MLAAKNLRPYALGPADRQLATGEPTCLPQLAVRKHLRLDAEFAVVAQLDSIPIAILEELEQQLAGLRLARWRGCAFQSRASWSSSMRP